MIRNGTPVLLVLLLAALTCTSAWAQVVFENANVILMTDDALREGWTVVVDGDRITDVGPSASVEIPEGAKRIDATGKYLIPGLAEMHGHVPAIGGSSVQLDDLFFLYLANGITTVRGMLGSPGQLKLKDMANSGDILAPSLYLAAPPFSGGSINSPEEAAERVRQYAEEGWDYLKVLPGLTRAEYDAMARTAQELGIPMIGHVPSDVGLEHAIRMGQQTIDHLDGYMEFLDGDEGTLDPERVERAVRLTRDGNVWMVPTMALWEVILGRPQVSKVTAYSELAYMPPQTVDQWTSAHTRRRAAPGFDQERVDLLSRNRIELLRALNEGGVRILLGTDSPQQFSVPGFSLRRELPLMVNAGMSPYEILVSGTRNVGEYLADADSFGTIEPGKRADLVLLTDNPFEDVTNVLAPEGVMVKGRWIPRSEIDCRLAAIDAWY